MFFICVQTQWYSWPLLNLPLESIHTPKAFEEDFPDSLCVFNFRCRKSLVTIIIETLPPLTLLSHFSLFHDTFMALYDQKVNSCSEAGEEIRILHNSILSKGRECKTSNLTSKSVEWEVNWDAKIALSRCVLHLNLFFFFF